MTRVLLLFVAFGVVASSSVPLLIVNDVHLNIFYDPDADRCLNYTSGAPSTKFPFGIYGCDPPSALVSSCLSTMAKTAPGAPVLIPGDLVAHDLKNESTRWDTLVAATNLFQTAFPDNTVVPCLGNNDFTSDYHYPLNTQTEWMNNLYYLWKKWIPVDQVHNFLNGGFHVQNISGSADVIALNTIFYSKKFVASNDTDDNTPTPVSQLPSDPNGQFNFLVNALERARGAEKKAIIIYHIGSGPDTYVQDALWHEKYLITFNTIIAKYQDTIAMQVGAHIHMDDFRLIWPGQPNQNGPLLGSYLVNPAVSPVFGNNPSFRVVFQNTSGFITDYHQYYLNLPKANRMNVSIFAEEYLFSDVYEASVVSSETLRNALHQISSDDAEFDAYLSRRYVQKAPDRSTLLCAIANQGLGNYEECAGFLEDDDK